MRKFSVLEQFGKLNYDVNITDCELINIIGRAYKDIILWRVLKEEPLYFFCRLFSSSQLDLIREISIWR